MTIEEQLREFDLTSSQRYEILAAHQESPDGLERVIKKASGANNPTAALISLVRKGVHNEDKNPSKGSKPPADTLDDIAAIAVRSYNARVAKYPPVDERGWTLDDAISYAVWVASTWSNERWSQDDIERAMRIRIGKPWTSDQDPALGTGCPPELKERILLKLRGFGDMPSEKPDPKLKIDANELAARLLATLEEEAA